ncbi:MAG: hypothetical protein ILP10_03000, partial [Lachnospiraceae bacterium]|nr:hypothetical protein [Lachnospiraceae bacterium]
MKEKIDRFAKGIFTYEPADLVISELEVSIRVETGRTFCGTFSVSNSADTPLKGIVCSSSSYLSFRDNSFSGKENIIEYVFDATSLYAGDVVKDSIIVISECGEESLPFEARVTPPSCESSVGSIRDSFHFANLAKTSWEEAQLVFMTESFERVLAYYDRSHVELYRHLKEGNSSPVAMEEFLIALHKKRRINFFADRTQVELDDSASDEGAKIVLSKDSWGFAELRLRTEEAFISLPANRISTFDFEGDSYVLRFGIDASKLHAGKNFGRIAIETAAQRLEVNVVCTKRAQAAVRYRRRDGIRALSALADVYLRYRMGDLGAGKYLAETNRLLASAKFPEEHERAAELYKIFALATGGRESMARTLLDIFKEDGSWKRKGITEYGAVVFLEGMLTKDSHTAMEVSSTLKGLLERDSDNALLYLFTYFSDRKNIRSPERRFDDMRRLYERGVRSRFLYVEALSLVNMDGSLLKELGDFECTVLYFGVKKKMPGRNLISQIAYLSSRSKQPGKLHTRLLKTIYEGTGSPEVLEALCEVLKKREDTGREAARYYRLAMSEQARVVKLHEYMLSAAYGDLSRSLPAQIFAFFLLGKGLEDRERKYLYANLIRFKDEHRAAYEEARQDIYSFATEALARGEIDEMLAVIYSDAFSQPGIDAETIARLPEVVYKHLITVESPRITKVAVASPAYNAETVYPVTDGKAYVDICMIDDIVFLIDEDGCKYCDSVPFEKTPLVRGVDIEQYVLDGLIDDDRSVLHTYDQINYEGTGEISPELADHIIKIEGLSDEFATECEKKLIYHYYDIMDDERLEERLVSIDMDRLSHGERIKLIEMMILKGLCHLALANIERSGFEGIDAKRLLRMCSVLLPVLEDGAVTQKLLKLCFYVFDRGKYDEQVLSLLVREYNGSIENMYEIFKAADGFDVDSTPLEERIVAQILFTESDMSFARTVFKRYYIHGSTKRLVRAFLSYYAYGYLRDEKLIDSELMQIMRRELGFEENDLVLLALIKGYSNQREPDEKDLRFVEYSIAKLEERGIVMKFFKEFMGKIRLPACVYDRYIVEYITRPSSRVMIHTRFDMGDEDFETLQMK